MRLASDCRALHRTSRGFTLVEMIIAIVITGILVAMVSMFGRRQIESYLDVSNRADLSDAADTALRRIGRDLQAALPNSVRNNDVNFLEFVPIATAGRYRADIGGGAGDDPLDFTSATDNSFDVFGPVVNIAAGEQLVIFNLGQPGSDVYDGTSRRAAPAGNNLAKGKFAPAGTPDRLVNRLAVAIKTVMANPELQKKYENCCSPMPILGEAEFSDYLKRDRAVWAKRASIAGIVPE